MSLAPGLGMQMSLTLCRVDMGEANLDGLFNVCSHVLQARRQRQLYGVGMTTSTYVAFPFRACPVGNSRHLNSAGIPVSLHTEHPKHAPASLTSFPSLSLTVPKGISGPLAKGLQKFVVAVVGAHDKVRRWWLADKDSSLPHDSGYAVICRPNGARRRARCLSQEDFIYMETRLACLLVSVDR